MSDDIKSLTRQQLYDRIKTSSKDEVVLQEMQKYGFWEKSEGQPSAPEALIKRESELSRELSDLLEKQRLFNDKEAALREMRKARMDAAKLKREETKQLRKQKAEEKAKRWSERKSKEIGYLGEEVSGGLGHRENDLAQLNKYGLPVFENEEALARAMEKSIGEIRFLAFNRAVSTISHYRRFAIPKKSGGLRHIAAPMPRLKSAQHWLYENVLSKIKLHDAAHGFVPGRSIVSNASPHLKAEVVMNLDLKDFFPTIDFHRVKGMFRKLGYSEQLAIIFALISTEPAVDEVEMDGRTYYVAKGERHLPQGSPASPVITNIICRRMDARFRGLAKKFNYTYSRYADDLTFSASGEPVKELKRFLAHIRQVIDDEDFNLHPKKIRIMRKGARKEVTGIVVNEKPAIPREDVRRFRALVHQIEKTGPEGKHWNGNRNVLAAMKGYANFITMVDPAKGKPLEERVKKLLVKHSYKHVIRHPSKGKVAAHTETAISRPPQDAIAPDAAADKKRWWKFW